MDAKRAREYGISIGRLPTGSLNSITDVAGVKVGHETVVREPAVRTGVTTIWPNDAPWDRRVYAGCSVLNGYGELVGISHINEWGLLASPIVLTSSLAIGLAYDATAKWIARLGPAEVPMPVVGECDDGFLNDALSFPLSEEDVVRALENAAGGPVDEGCVGAGTGMQCFDFKGGIGTSSRVIPEAAGGFSVGALVLTNFGSRADLRIDGVPVGREILDLMPEYHTDGSAIGIVATDAPMLPHQLRRLAQRAELGLGRCGSIGENWSGEILCAFSTAQSLAQSVKGPVIEVAALPDGPSEWRTSALDPLFAATVEAVEEAVVNALFAAETTVGLDGHVLHALPIDRTLEVLERAGRVTRNASKQAG